MVWCGVGVGEAGSFRNSCSGEMKVMVSCEEGGDHTHAADLGEAAGLNGHLQAGLAQGHNVKEARRLADLRQRSLVCALGLVRAVRVHGLKGRARPCQHRQVEDSDLFCHLCKL